VGDINIYLNMQRLATKFIFAQARTVSLSNLQRLNFASVNFICNQRRMFSNIDAAVPAHEVDKKSFAEDYDEFIKL
jgi:hypothetical protein